jgi:hypothetical protein
MEGVSGVSETPLAPWQAKHAARAISFNEYR